ncbi:MAG TPA: sigma-70 family RNA polymerase sigma factor [Gemmataceae bacterium]|nr:sigma-70 family RNA polymerase sigma factor [Gemmataceae bacterium]
MAKNTITEVVGHIRQIAAVQSSRELSDCELLERFIGDKDDAAFTVLVERHGPLVLGVCRRALGNPDDAEDAWQATFLVLARKAASIRKTASLSCWLHRVASSVAANLRRERSRRTCHEREVRPPTNCDAAAELTWREVRAALDEELDRLPERYRAPIILCYLDGRTRDEAARLLALTPGALHGRLERARRMLCERLTRRGLTLSGALLATGLGAGAAQAALSPTVALSAIKAAVVFAGGEMPMKGLVSTHALSLAQEVLKKMLVTKLTFGTATVLGVGIFLATVGGTFAPARSPQNATLQRGKDVAVAVKNPDHPEDAGAADARALEGEWQAVELEVNGKKNASEDVKELRMIFKANEITVKSASGEGRERKQTFKLVPGHSPKAIDITSLDGQEKGQTAACIYTLKKDRLIICYPQTDPGKRPAEFKTQNGDGRMIIKLVRVGSKEAAEEAVTAKRVEDPAATEYAAIQREWQKVENEFWKNYDKAKTPEERSKVAANKESKCASLAQRALKLAEANLDHPVALSALCCACGLAPNADAAKRARAHLMDGRIARADPDVLAHALESGKIRDGQDQELARAVLERVKQLPDHPRAGALLAWVCCRYFRNNSAEVPRPFAEAAELIVAHCADQPGIEHFCETLGWISAAPPPWAGKYERHLRIILEKNRDRLVRAAAAYALAMVVQSAGESRQLEAAKLFEQFAKDFDGSVPKTAGVEKVLIDEAITHAEEIRLRRVGMPAPEIEGADLDGRPMKLSQFRGKVILLSFWATTCAPCMKLIPHERALVERLRDKPFVMVGVNEDADEEQLRSVLKKTPVTWRSFKAQRPGKPGITEEWKLLGIPTLYLIDHNGIIRKRWVGGPPLEELNGLVDELVATASRKK